MRGRGQLVEFLQKKFGWSEPHATATMGVMLVGIGEDALGKMPDRWLLEHARTCESIRAEAEEILAGPEGTDG